MYRRAALSVVACLAVLTLAACGGGGGGNEPPANISPTANAGSAQTVVAGSTVTLNGSSSSDPDGSIAAYAWTQAAGTPVTLTSPGSATPTFVAPQVAASTTLQFALVVTDNRGANSGSVTALVTVSPAVAGDVVLTGTVRFTRVPFHAGSPFGLNYAAQALQPARGVVVRALNQATQELATGVTDANGAYSLSVPANAGITLQVLARMQRDASPRWNVRVQAGVNTLPPYAFDSAVPNSNVGVHDIVIPSGITTNGAASGVRASGPFAILDTIYTAIQAVLAVAPTAEFPNLYVDWGSQSEGTFFSTANGQHITLSSDLSEDTDEFDQHVVAHEFGHYIEYNFSRSDSIGGPHGLGDRLDMRVAFGEGFGYAFAAIVLNDPDVRDSFVSSGMQVAGRFLVENNPSTTGCWCSESSVWSMLWDLHDTAPDGSDNLSIGFASIWQVLTGAQRTTPAMTSIFSFIEALKVARPADVPAINALVAAQNIEAANINAFATTQVHTPFPNMLPLYADIGVSTPVVVRSSGVLGPPQRLYNKAGNRRFLRFVPTTSGPVTVTLTTSNPNAGSDPDFLVFRSGILVAVGTEPPAAIESETFNVTAGQTYIIDAYDCANGCDPDPVQGTPGDYDLTVSIN
jgi:hypothetical protein